MVLLLEKHAMFHLYNRSVSTFKYKEWREAGGLAIDLLG